MITVTCASIPSRVHNLEIVCRALSPQADAILLCLNGYRKVPEFVHELPNVEARIDLPDMGDAGKFAFDVRKGIHLTVDDDLYLPEDYVRTMAHAVERYRCEYVVSLHGRRFDGPGPFGSYYKGATSVYRCLGDLEEDEPIHVPGTGVMAYDAGRIHLSFSDFKLPNMADVWAGRILQQKKVGVVCARHKTGFLVHQEIDQSTTIHSMMSRNGHEQTRLINELAPWKTYAQI